MAEVQKTLFVRIVQIIFYSNVLGYLKIKKIKTEILNFIYKYKIRNIINKPICVKIGVSFSDLMWPDK